MNINKYLMPHLEAILNRTEPTKGICSYCSSTEVGNGTCCYLCSEGIEWTFTHIVKDNPAIRVEIQRALDRTPEEMAQISGWLYPSFVFEKDAK